MMEIFFYLVIFFLGSSVGSFLNVLVYRIPRGESFFSGRSYCDECKKKLAWHDLVPIVSFLLLGGRCRYCKSAISMYYPIVEKLTGVLFVLVVFSLIGREYTRLLEPTELMTVAYYLYITSALTTIFLTDLKYGIIPFKVVFPAIAVTLLWYVVTPVGGNFLLGSLLSAVGVFAFFFLLFFLTKGRGLGFGDVVYVLLMGLLLGFPKIILGLYISFLSGAIISLILVVARRKQIKGGTIPFGPFLVSGTIISMLWGEVIIDKILGYLM